VREKLAHDLTLLQKQRFWLAYSLKACKAIGIREHYTPEAFGQFETLCARYARSIDFLIRKFYRTLDAFEFEESGTLIDIIHRAHKRGLIDSVEEMRLLKELRNEIVHEYIEEDLTDYFKEVLEASHKVLRLIDRAETYTLRLLD